MAFGIKTLLAKAGRMTGCIDLFYIVLYWFPKYLDSIKMVVLILESFF
jgi:hypothetical protein